MMNDHCNRHGVSNVLTQPTNTLNLVLIAHHSLMSTCLFGIQLFGLPVIIRYAGTGNTIGCMGYGPPYNIGRPVWDSIGEKFVTQAVFWGLDLKIYNNKLLLAKVSSKNDNGLFNFCQISFWFPPPLHQSMCFSKSPLSLPIEPQTTSASDLAKTSPVPLYLVVCLLVLSTLDVPL